MAMLSRPLALHNPNCRGLCAPGDCIENVEAFANSVLERFGRGERVGHEPGSHAFLSGADREDALAYLVESCWQAWRDFRPEDDGRQSNKLAGYAVWVLHRRHTHWLRKRYGSTRYSANRIVTSVTPAADVEKHLTGVWLDQEFSDGDALDLEAAPDGTREALELLRPLIDDKVQTYGQAAARAGVKDREITKAVQLVRAAARRQGLEPLAAANEERQALADHVADLREQGMTFKEIAAELGLRPSRPAVLLREYHPSSSRGGGRPTRLVR